ncbi:zinc finger protein 771-like isoform X2 [Sphaeramia orbicularis]|uniref:zinc finger protein 771-like isoform X2 n=1 Tax=Sphaeramia orbicularis TaxID=375764 RepID=UPI00117DE397|nr:zinc finger protein 771-like isoform X2 [Sphaeramia orbicularis]
MPTVQMLRAAVEQSLSAAAEDIFKLLERTVTEYEDQVRHLKQENELKQKLLDAAWNPRVLINAGGVHQLLVVKEGVSILKEGVPSVDQGDAKSPYIKEEYEVVEVKQEEEQFQGLEEADMIELPSPTVTVKNEDDDEEKPQSSELHQRQSEEDREETDGEDCGGSEAAGSLHPHRQLETQTDDQTEDSSDRDTDDDWTPNRESESHVKKVTKPPSSINNNDLTGSKTKPHAYIHIYETPHNSEALLCSVCGAGFTSKLDLDNHMKFHTEENPFLCSVCCERFPRKSALKHHMKVHSGGKVKCLVCKKGFQDRTHLRRHMTRHTGEKPFECLDCGRRFAQKSTLVQHKRLHTGERPFSCSECGASFSHRSNMRSHVKVHAREKSFNKQVGDSVVKATDKGEKQFECSLCGFAFARKSNLTRHMSVHTGAKPFSCSVCKRFFAHKRHAQRHMSVHLKRKRANPAKQTDDFSD